MVLRTRFFAQSLVVRLGIALGTIFTLALAGTISATVFAELSSGKAAAINMAGSLRMQSYWVTVQVLVVSENQRSFSDLRNSMAEFEKRLTSTQIIGGVPADPSDVTRRAYDRVSSQWFGKVKPAVFRTAAAGLAGREEFVTHMAAFVRDVDSLVSLLEQEQEDRIQNLKSVQSGTLFFTIIVMIIALYLLHTQVIVPMRDLLHCARRVRAGDFSARARHAGEDELGQLGQSFNFMVADLSRSYADLEARVEEKTEELARSNMSLEVLYNTTRRLAENKLTEVTLRKVMQDIERAIGIEVAAICAREENEPRGFPIVRKLSAPDGRSEPEHCAECLCAGQAGIQAVGSGPDRMLAVPLTEGGKPYGVMLVRAPSPDMDEWRLKLIESIGHHIGAALAAAKRGEEKGRIALIEERSVIARELHDSLAQALAYLNIQVTRLRSSLFAANEPPETKGRSFQVPSEVNEIVEELKVGLNNAYRQLRELLTTFRLGMHSRGLSDALAEAIREFSRRNATEYRLHNRLLGHELDASEQIHVLQVVREALTNVEHHARAEHADVRLDIADGRVRVIVEDDGIGIPASTPPEHHYGLAIMHDRAASLGGEIRISRRIEGGTRVELEFSPRGPYARESTGAQREYFPRATVQNPPQVPA